MKTSTQYTDSRLELVKGERIEPWYERYTGALLLGLLLLAGLVGGIAG